MFKIFSSKKAPTRGSSGQSKKKDELVSKRDGLTERKVMEGAERELYQYEQPTQELGMTDLVKRHEEGTRFMYAAITGREPEDIGAKMRRLASFQPVLKKKAVPIENLPTVKLYKETESFPLDQVMPRGKVKTYGDYVRVSDALVMYGAIVSPDCHFTKVKVGITDNRLLNNNLVKSFVATSNIAARGNLALPYCVPVEDIDQLILTVSRERSFIAEGRQWGALQIQLVVEFMAFPMQFENQTVVAQNMLPPSALETPAVDPNHVDVSILNNNRDDLYQLFLSGDLVDETEPIADKTEAVKYVQSTMRTGQKKGKAIEVASEEYSFMKGARKNVPAGLNSVEPSEDGSFNPPSIHSIDDGEAPVKLQLVGRPATPPSTKLRSAMKSPSPPVHKRNVSFGTETAVNSQTDSPLSRVNNVERLTPWG
jgi:hypothetical protein